MVQETSSSDLSAAVEAILAWWPEVRATRDALPWRTTTDPWLTLMAELMLGQTQVERVATRFVELSRRFPTPEACASVTQAEVVSLWVGLGYNRRAVALHRCAIIIRDRHEGVVPRSLEALLELPGVGPYTARAILAFAYDDPVGVVDTNIGRVLARALRGSALAPREAQSLADGLVPEGRSREWNLALMDFGSLVCRSRSPQCDDCVLAPSHCRWQRELRDRPGEITDPSVGSGAGKWRQSRFDGSDRQGRGRLVKAACAGTVRGDDLAWVMGWPEQGERARRVAAGLVREGVLVTTSSGNYQLA